MLTLMLSPPLQHGDLPSIPIKVLRSRKTSLFNEIGLSNRQKYDFPLGESQSFPFYLDYTIP